MKKVTIVANWKSNVSLHEVDAWTKQMENCKWHVDQKEVIVCSPFTLLQSLKSLISDTQLGLKLGAQDVSPFPKGAYTGEVAAIQLKEFVQYVIVGHSERRKYFYEDDQMLANKVDMALEAGLLPIFCVQDVHAIIPKGVRIVAYEPVFAIGTGEPDSPENADDVAREIKETVNVATVLYGGSVSSENVRTFTSMENIDGVLVGSASLDPVSFSSIVTNA